MAEKEDVVVSIGPALGLVEELQKAFDELESHREDSLHNKAHWQDVKEHFQNLGRSLKEKSEGIEEREKAFQVKLSESRESLAEREAGVAVKERGFLNRLQELKDAAVSAVSEARKKCKLEIPAAPVTIEKKVSTVDSVPQLKQICEEMDSKGLVKFILEYGKHHMSLRKELSIALKNVPQPARLVLEALEGFYPPADQPITTSRGNEKDIRRNFLVLIESIPDNLASSEIKQQAKAIVDEWKPKLAALDLDASNGNSSEALAFFQIVTIFGVESGFDEDELCELVLAVSRRRQAPELCRSLGLTHKMPGVTEALVSKGRPLDAVHFAYAFNLTESFPPLPLLKAFLNLIGINSHDTSTGSQNDASSEELTALRTIVKYIEDFKLQDEYPLAPLQKRVSQIKKEKNIGRAPEAAGKFVSKKARVNSGYPPRGVDSWRPPARVFDERIIFPAGGGVPERYPYTAPPPSYEASYGVQRAYHPPPISSASYGSYMDSGLPTAAANHGTYSSSGYQSAAAAAAAAAAPPANYGSYPGAGFQPSH